jgi:hypothetical protein
MRARAVALIALGALPVGLSAQVIRLPRPSERTPTQPAPPPSKEVPEVARALSYHRSRWSGEAYGLISAVRVPPVNGAITSYTTYGTGSRADYRITDHLSATADLTYSPLGGFASTQTAEVGARLSPFLNNSFHPFVDVRGGFMNMSDRYSIPVGQQGIPGQQYMNGERYSRGFGAIVGTGIVYFARPSWAITAEASAMRGALTTYRLTNVASLPVGTNYDMTSFRFAVGLRYNAARALMLAQNPRS